jgi:hypothetical protein
MIRNLKILLAAAMALAAFGAFSASAHAAEEKFHCSVEPCTWTLQPDEAAGTTTAHHVFVVKGTTAAGAEASVSFTCNQLTGHATSAVKTPTELTFTNLTYTNSANVDKCKVGASETVTVDFNGCHYLFTSTGGATAAGSEVHVQCPAGAAIVVTIKDTACLSVTPFTSPGIKYHDSGLGGAKHIGTATANVAVPKAAMHLTNVGDANCSAIGLSTLHGATYTTGNTLITGETEAVPPVMANVWFE